MTFAENTDDIPFNRPYMTGRELHYICQAHLVNQQFSGNGPFTKSCQRWLTGHTSSSGTLLTHSCTAALEMAALLANVGEGDEIIMPSYTFVSTATAFALRGCCPVFLDIRPDTLNINETLLESAINSRTRVIVPVHYAGVGCEMDVITSLAKKYDILVIEDAAQAIMSSYHGYSLGAIGDLGTYSFHETKNVICGEGGALLINNQEFTSRAEIIWEKGTDRSRFFRGETDRYTWQDIGSSFLPGELTAAFLLAQLEEARTLTTQRLRIWSLYHEYLAPLENQGYIRRPIIPKHCQHNAHMYYIILAESGLRADLIRFLKCKGISSIIHYVPLHNSPGGKLFGRCHGELTVTEEVSESILRLPLWIGMEISHIERVVMALTEFYRIR